MMSFIVIYHNSHKLLTMSKRGIHIILMCIQVHMPSKLKFCKGICVVEKDPTKNFTTPGKEKKETQNHNPLISMTVAVVSVAPLFGCNVVLEVV